jgi:hypothetical protein
MTAEKLRTRTMTLSAFGATVGHMAHEDKTNKRDDSWRFFYLPLIIGLILGSAAAAATDQWWWATVGAVVGAAAGEAARRSGISHSSAPHIGE